MKYSKISSNGSEIAAKIKKASTPFPSKILSEAKAIASNYRILVEKHKKLGYIGSSIDLPNIYVDSKTEAGCLKATREALVGAVATMLENNLTPPQKSSLAKRTIQVNVRLTTLEKAQLSAAVERLGFEGLSGFFRFAAFQLAYQGHKSEK